MSVSGCFTREWSSVLDPDPHHFGNLDLPPDPHQIKIRIRIKVISCIRNRIWIRIDLKMIRQNAWNISLFLHFFKGSSLYLEARIWIWTRIRIRGRVKSLIQIRIRIRINKNHPHQGDQSNLC
jgi:hypothetical protein